MVYISAAVPSATKHSGSIPYLIKNIHLLGGYVLAKWIVKFEIWK